MNEVDRVLRELAKVEAAAERVRDDVGAALADVYAGAGMVEADALLDKLRDRGLRVVRL